MSGDYLLCCCCRSDKCSKLMKDQALWRTRKKRKLLAKDSDFGSKNTNVSSDYLNQETTTSSKTLPISSSSENGMYAKGTEVCVDYPNTNPVTQYSLVKKIGSGGFGTVFICEDRKTKQKVAIKRIRGKARNEIMLTKKISHKFIIEYISSYSFGKRTILILEYIPGKKLSEIITSQNQGYFPILPEMCISYLSKQCLEALEYIHERKIIHLDIKADNIFVNFSGNLKLFDFGLSFELKKPSYSSTFIRGTPNWLPPEVLQKQIYTTKCDIWSFGVTLVEMISGYPLNNTNFKYNKYITNSWNIKKVGVCAKHELSCAFRYFINRCFTIECKDRPSATELLTEKFIIFFNQPYLLVHLQCYVIQLVNN